MKKNRKYLFFFLLLIFTSCIQRGHHRTWSSMNSEERLKRSNDEHSRSLEVLNVDARKQYPYIKEFTDSLIKSGLNYVQYMDKNKIVDCSKIVNILRVKKGKLLENRQWMDDYFRKIDTYEFTPYRIDAGNYAVFDRVGRVITDSTVYEIKYELYDLEQGNSLTLNFTYDTLFSKDKFESNLKLNYLDESNNPYGINYKRYLTEDIQEHCHYLKEFMLELINHKYDYIEYLKNNPYVKIRESESFSIEMFGSKDNKNLNYYDKKRKNYVDCVFKDECIFFSTLDEDDLEECMKLHDQGLFYSVHGCNDEISFNFYFEPNPRIHQNMIII